MVVNIKESVILHDPNTLIIMDSHEEQLRDCDMIDGHYLERHPNELFSKHKRFSPKLTLFS